MNFIYVGSYKIKKMIIGELLWSVISKKILSDYFIRVNYRKVSYRKRQDLAGRRLTNYYLQILIIVLTFNLGSDC